MKKKNVLVGTISAAFGVFACLTVAGVGFLERPRVLDSPVAVRSPDGSWLAHGTTIARMRVLGNDDYVYRFSVEDDSGNQLFENDIPIPMNIWRVETPETVTSRGVNDVTFEDNGQIVWSTDGHSVAFVIHGTEVFRQHVR